jgi:hypothetical protein
MYASGKSIRHIFYDIMLMAILENESSIYYYILFGKTQTNIPFMCINLNPR